MVERLWRYHRKKSRACRYSFTNRCNALVHVIHGEVALHEKQFHTGKAKHKHNTVFRCKRTTESAPWNSHHTVTETTLCVKPVTLLLNGMPTLKPWKHIHMHSSFDGSKPRQGELGLVKNKCVACSTLAAQKNKNKHLKFNKNTKNPTQNIPKSEPPLFGREFDNTRPALQPPKL